MRTSILRHQNLQCFFVFVSFFLFAINSFSQKQEHLFGRVNIASPAAASIGKYGDIPVSYHTGVPNISIPIHTLSAGSLQLPVSLSYHAGGLRVEENDSWVGAGWTLNAGGVITRTVRDKPDEARTGSMTQSHGYFSDYGFFSTPKTNQGAIALPDYVDKEPDLFSFSFNGQSGKFYFNDDRTPMMVPEQDIKIEYDYTPGVWNGSPGLWSGLNRCIEGFRLTTPDGTKYYFGINPINKVTAPYCDPIEVTSTYTSTTGSNYSQVITSWFLYKIESVDGAHSITLHYLRDRFSYYTYVNNFNYKSTDNNNRYSLVKNYVAGVRLSKILSKTGSVDFTGGNARQDLSGWNLTDVVGLNDYANTGSPTLGSIEVFNAQNQGIKKFNFNYDYFTASAASLPAYFQGWGINNDTKRLKLVSVQEQSSDGTVNNPPYSFDYFTTEPIVRRLCFAKDHWGFNNGATANAELYPALITNNGPINSAMGLPTANREASWPAMRAGTLSKITYPTGGYTNFEFEQHKFYVLENGVNTDKTVGGLRVKSITSFDPVANKTAVTNYSYLEGNTNLSSGILFSKPTYIQIFRNELTRKVKHFGINNNGCLDPYDPNTVRGWPYVLSDNPLRPMETTQGNHIGYKEVKVSQPGNGYSIYRFYTGPTWPLPDRSSIAVTKVNYPGTCDLSIPNLPAAPPVHDFKRGELVYEGVFNANGEALTEKNILNTYTENPVTAPGLLTGNYFSVTPEETFYELKTARLQSSTVQEIIYQKPGATSMIKGTQTFYESIYHHQPTRIVTTDSRGGTSEKRIKYAFDYRVPLFENINTCSNPSASFLTYLNSLYATTYEAAFAQCVGGYTDTSCYNSNWRSLRNTLFSNRQSYINCRRNNYTNLYRLTTPLNTYQVNHNRAKDDADAELKPILWMQDIYMNAPIEISAWKNGQLLNASYAKYSNLRDDEFGVYPEKVLKIDLQAPSATFTNSQVSTNGNSIIKDSRYAEDGIYDFNEGNIINTIGREGVSTSYAWAYNNSLPTARLTNASNKQKQILQPGTRTNYYAGVIGPSNTCVIKQESFKQSGQGAIVLSIASMPPSNASVNVSYTLTGPNGYSQTGSLCKLSSEDACNGSLSTVVFNNMPSGSYSVSYSMCTNFPSFSFQSTLALTYMGMIVTTSGSREFFVANFEEDGNSTIGAAHTGNKFYNGNYTLSWIPPNARNYTIQWWQFVNNKWVFNAQNYSNGMVLNGPVDDVRIFPKDAQISTYTYSASGQITSEIDTRGRTQFYIYDQTDRLVMIMDNENNVVKKVCYNYSGQVINCNPSLSNPPVVPTTYYNATRSQTFTRGNCGSGYVGSQVAYVVPANTYSSTISQQDADGKAQTDINLNGQNYANTNGTCTQIFNVSGTNSKSKAYTITFSGSGGATFTLPIGANGVIGQVPAGTYNVSFSPVGSPVTVTFKVNGFTQSNVQWATFYNISVTGTTTVSVY